jgi:hypothetical protein
VGKKLNEREVLRLMREEWDRRVGSFLLEADDVPIKAGGTSMMLSPELKLVHKRSRLRYTIDSVGARDVVLRTPEGDTFVVDTDTLEKEYGLD